MGIGGIKSIYPILNIHTNTMGVQYINPYRFPPPSGGGGFGGHGTLNTGLLSVYDLESDGTDSVGSNDLTGTNVSYVSGINGNAVDMNGANSKLVGSFTGAASASAFSISYWIYLDGTSVQTDNVWLRDASNSNTERFGIITSGGAYYLVFGNNSSGQYGTVSPGITTGSWFHVVIVFDGAGATNADKVKLYVNTVSKTISFNSSPSTTLGANYDEFVVGTWEAQGVYTNGQYDGVYLWNKALSSSEVSDLYAGGTGLFYTD